MTADHPSESHHHESDHGHAHDQGLKGMVRYLRFGREMWRSDVNDAVVARLAPQAGESVMDIGAGAGAGTMIAIKSGAHVVAVEPTPYLRTILRIRRALQRVQDRVTVVEGSAESTGVEGGSIDAVFAVNTMHHWTDLNGGIAEVARVLARGGRVLLVEENFDDPSHPEYERFGEKRREEHAHHFDTVDPGVVAAELERMGLTVVSADSDEIAGRPAVIIEALA